MAVILLMPHRAVLDLPLPGDRTRSIAKRLQGLDALEVEGMLEFLANPIAETTRCHVELTHQGIGPRGTARGLGDVSEIPQRSEERRVGNECVRTCRYRWVM